jgi:hypothetical protein
MKRIKINDAFFIETDADTKEYEGKYEIEEIPKNPNDYKPDGSDRPETIRERISLESQKREQENIDEEINKPTIIKDLKGKTDKTEKELKSMSYTDLVELYAKIMADLVRANINNGSINLTSLGQDL